MVRILVTGSRDWSDTLAVVDAIQHHATLNTVVVHGDCPTGADAIADDLATRIYGLTPERHPADWAKHGKRAGFVRNAEMVALGADVCLAFLSPCAKPGCHRGEPGHPSHGGAMTADLAEKAGIPTRRVMSR